MKTYSKLKNIAIVAHVDHGKTTLVDGLLGSSGTFSARQEVVDCVMDSGELERERGITITAKNCAIIWNDTKINLVDTPGHADFGGEVERALMMVDGILLLVDAAEGPLPQTRFVLQKALERKLKVSVVINKVDRPDQRLEEVQHEIENLFIELLEMLDIHDFDFDMPILYASGRERWAGFTPDTRGGDLRPLLDLMTSDYYPDPPITPGDDFQMLVANLSYSPYLGQLMVGRIQRGTVQRLGNYTWCGPNSKTENFKVTAIQVFDALGTTEVDTAKAGEIVILAGMSHSEIGDTISAWEKPDALPRVEVEPPTVSVQVSVNTSPLAGKEGDYLTSRKLEEYLQSACRLNVALRYTQTEDPKVFTLKGRGELQLAIVFEELRRKGFEFMVSKPQVITTTDDQGHTLEPFERVVIDIPTEFTGILTDKLSTRKGKMDKMIPLGKDRSRIEFIIPSRGLIGYHSVFMTDTKGQGLMSSEFLGFKPHAGSYLARVNGAIISDRTGIATAYALWGLLSSGKQFVMHGEPVYEGMVVGEHTRQNDLNVNCCREKHLTNVRNKNKDENMIFPPIPERNLEWAMDWIENDEWVEVTPKSVRVRKKGLLQRDRSVIRR